MAIVEMIEMNIRWAEGWGRPRDMRMIARGLRVDEHQADRWSETFTTPGEVGGYAASIESMTLHATRAGNARGWATALLLGDMPLPERP